MDSGTVLQEPLSSGAQQFLFVAHTFLKQAYQQHGKLVRMGVVFRHDLREYPLKQSQVIRAKMDV